MVDREFHTCSAVHQPRVGRAHSAFKAVLMEAATSGKALDVARPRAMLSILSLELTVILRMTRRAAE